jgi:hypothetical protein
MQRREQGLTKRKRPKKRTVITTETHQITIVHPRTKLVRAWCDQCQADSEMAPPEAAAALLGITPREVYRRVENGALHFMETEGGGLLICCRQAGRLEGFEG